MNDSHSRCNFGSVFIGWMLCSLVSVAHPGSKETVVIVACLIENVSLILPGVLWVECVSRYWKLTLRNGNGLGGVGWGSPGRMKVGCATRGNIIPWD